MARGGLRFHPKRGAVLICDFRGGFVAPEMTKARPVVVISPKSRSHGNLCTVVCLSSVEPRPPENHHHLLEADSLPRPLQSVATWAKCDMIYRVGFHRLDRVKQKQRDRRRYLDHRVTEHDLAAIERAVLHGVGLGRLTEFV